MPKFQYNLYKGKFIPWLEHSIAFASILTIVAISVERYFAISAPLKVNI